MDQLNTLRLLVADSRKSWIEEIVNGIGKTLIDKKILLYTEQGESEEFEQAYARHNDYLKITKNVHWDYVYSTSMVELKNKYMDMLYLDNLARETLKLNGFMSTRPCET